MGFMMDYLANLFKIENKKNVGLRGLSPESFCVYIYDYFMQNDKSVVIVTPTLFEANKILNSLSSYTNDVLFFPMDDFLTSMAIAISPDLKVTRIETLINLLDGKKKIIVTHLMGYLRYLPTKKVFKDNILNLKVGDKYDIKDLASHLIDIGYTREALVSKTGDFAFRGYVLDVFPVSEDNPIRIEFFGDEIDSIRYFDVDNQTSIKKTNEVSIYPITEFLYDKENPNNYDNQKYLKELSTNVVNINDYLDDFVLFVKDYPTIKAVYKETQSQIKEYKESKDKDYKGNYMHNLDLFKIPSNHYLTKDSLLKDFDLKYIDFPIKEVPSFHENLEAIENYLKQHSNKTIILCLNICI